MGEDTKHLFDAEKKDRIITFVQKQLNKYRLAIGSTGVFILFLIVIMYNQCDQINFYKQNAKMNYLSIYQIEQKMTKEDRRKDAMEMIMKVGLKYQININEKLLAEVADIVFSTGEVVYGIPVEESILWITLESEWKATAKSKSGAKGVTQLMPVIALLMAKDLGIPYLGDPTVYDMKSNMKMGLRWLYLLKSQYKKPAYYYTIYFWGPQSSEFAEENKKITGKYRTYFYTDMQRIKGSVEKILGKKIHIEGLE